MDASGDHRIDRERERVWWTKTLRFLRARFADQRARFASLASRPPQKTNTPSSAGGGGDLTIQALRDQLQATVLGVNKALDKSSATVNRV